MAEQQNNPLHGLTLKLIVETLEAKLGFEKMGHEVKINCFTSDPSIKSSLKFLRKTSWAREKAEQLYLSTIANKEDNKAGNKVRQKTQQPKEAFVWPDLTKKHADKND